jgi:hypothetical protein
VSRWTLPAIALLLLVAIAWRSCAIRGQARSPRLWIEAYARPRAACYQGPPRREAVHVQLWSGGPGIRLMQERPFNPPPMEERP